MKQRYAMFTPEIIHTIKQRVDNGEYLHNVAADYGCNSGRIAEIKWDYPWVVENLGLPPIEGWLPPRKRM